MPNAEPVCGTPAARALFIVLYRDEGSVQLAEFQSCCAQHEPPDFTVFIDEAEVVQTDISDSYKQLVNDGEFVTAKWNPSPGHFIDPEQPWAWTMANNPVRKVDRLDPKGWFHVNPIDAQRR